jgi:hypothetical protein
VAGEHDAVHPLASQCQGQQVMLRVHVKRDAIQDFRRLSRDVATRGCRADERLDDRQQMHGEFVFFWGHLVLTPSELGGEERKHLPESVDSGERVQAVVTTEVCGDSLKGFPSPGALQGRTFALRAGRHLRSSRAEEQASRHWKVKDAQATLSIKPICFVGWFMIGAGAFLITMGV